MAFLSRQALEELGFASLGENVYLSDKASVYNPGNIRIGSNVRIDDFCVLSAGVGGIDIGDYIHVAVFSSLIGSGNIALADFVNISSRVSIYSSNDDYSGGAMTNPMIPEQFKNVQSANVRLEKHVIVGSGSVVLPGITLHEGVAVGALSLVSKDCEAFKVYSGVPARALKDRKRDLKRVEKDFLKTL